MKSKKTENNLLYPKIIFVLSLLIMTSCNKAEVLTDNDGNKYKTKIYGETIWMLENLRVKQNKSGNTVKFYFPNNDAKNIKEYGLLYDYKTACKVCPKGWRLPNNNDWEKLFGVSNEDSIKKFKNHKFWKGVQNTNSFSIKLSGYGNNGEHNNNFKSTAILWSKSKEDEHFVWTYTMKKDVDSINKASQHPTYAFSIRCIKNIK